MGSIWQDSHSSPVFSAYSSVASTRCAGIEAKKTIARTIRMDLQFLGFISRPLAWDRSLDEFLCTPLPHRVPQYSPRRTKVLSGTIPDYAGMANRKIGSRAGEPCHIGAMTDTAPAPILSGNKICCTHCPGYCCYRLAGSTLCLDAIVICRIARHFGISDGKAWKRCVVEKNTFKTRSDGSCILLSSDKICARCSIHEARPRQCRQFPHDQPCPYLEREDLR
jgi:uncharacterized protein